LEAFAHSGVNRVAFVAGYRAEAIKALYPKLDYYINDR
jgi:hypothetical protein